MHYRSEIDGLRALSVILIILFHLELPRFSGGFVGVDVFFVISGFLLTGIISDELRAGEFSLRRFYLRRIARLVPALAVTVFVTLLVAALLLPPENLLHTAQQSLMALASLSNFFFWLEADYWAPKARDFLLLHTWSLGVEEQFYLVYPLLLWLAYRRWPQAGLTILLSGLFTASLAANLYLLRDDRMAAFYVSPLRFYEFAIGGLASLLLARLDTRARLPAMMPALATLAGLALIAYAALHYNFFTLFPGTAALVPTAGAALVIVAGASPPARWLLANRVMTWLGRISYSLYLVHWPLIVLYRYFNGPHIDAADSVFIVLLTLLLAAALNRWVERPLRLAPGDRATRSGLAAGTALRLTGGGVLATALLATFAMAGHGWPGRYPEHLQAVAGYDVRAGAQEKRAFVKEHCTPRKALFCGRRHHGETNILALADSRGLDIYPALLAAYPGANIRLSQSLGCIPVFDRNIAVNRFTPDCPDLNQRRLRAALAAPEGEVVFLLLNFRDRTGQFVVETARRLVEGGKRVYVMGQTRFLEGKTPRQIVLDQALLPLGDSYLQRFLRSQPFELDKKYRDQFAAVGATYISNAAFFADGEGSYRLFNTAGDELLTHDGVHFSSAGAREYGQYLAEHHPLSP